MKLLSLYDDQHTHPVNRALHMIAIPLSKAWPARHARTKPQQRLEPKI